MYNAFVLLVESGIIDLWMFFLQHEGEGNKTEKEYIRSYAIPVNSRQAFDFLKRLSERRPASEWFGIFGGYFHDHFFTKRYDYGHRQAVELHLQRDFLSDAELRQLYSWVDESIFCTESGINFEHVVYALGSSCVQRIFPKEQLAKVLKALEAAKAIDRQSAASFMELFFTPEELEEDRQARAVADA